MESESLYIIAEVTELLAALIYYRPYCKKELEKKYLKTQGTNKEM